MISKLYCSISCPISGPPPPPAESLDAIGALMIEPSELDDVTDWAWVEADWRAGVRPQDSTMSIRDVITPKVYAVKTVEVILFILKVEIKLPECFLGRQSGGVIHQAVQF